LSQLARSKSEIPVVVDAQQAALLAIAVAEDLFVAVKTVAAKPTLEVVVEIALVESEVLADSLRCFMNALKGRPGWAEVLLTAFIVDAHCRNS
jgi:hypothetical protein